MQVGSQGKASHAIPPRPSKYLSSGGLGSKSIPACCLGDTLRHPDEVGRLPVLGPVRLAWKQTGLWKTSFPKPAGSIMGRASTNRWLVGTVMPQVMRYVGLLLVAKSGPAGNAGGAACAISIVHQNTEKRVPFRNPIL